MDQEERAAFIAEAARMYYYEDEETYAQWLMDRMVTMTHKDLALIAGAAIALYSDEHGMGRKETW